MKLHCLALNNGHHSFIEHLLYARHGQVLPLREKLAPKGLAHMQAERVGGNRLCL